MFKRLKYLILVFFISIPSLFANFIVTTFENTLGNDGLGALLSSTEVMYGLYFIVILITMQTLFKTIFSGVMKLGEKPSGTLAFMFSFIGTSGIFFMFGSNREGLVTLLGSTFGLVLTFVLGMFMFKLLSGVAKGEDKFTARWLFWYASGLMVLSLLMYSVASNWIDKPESPDYLVTVISVFSFLLLTSILVAIGALIKMIGSKKSSESKQKIKTPDDYVKESQYNKEILSSMKELQDNNKEIQNSLNSIIKRRGGTSQ